MCNLLPKGARTAAAGRRSVRCQRVKWRACRGRRAAAFSPHLPPRTATSALPRAPAPPTAHRHLLGITVHPWRLRTGSARPSFARQQPARNSNTALRGEQLGHHGLLPPHPRDRHDQDGDPEERRGWLCAGEGEGEGRPGRRSRRACRSRRPPRGTRAVIRVRCPRRRGGAGSARHLPHPAHAPLQAAACSPCTTYPCASPR